MMKYTIIALTFFSFSSFAETSISYKCEGLTLEQAELMSQYGELDEVYGNGGSTEAADLTIQIQASAVDETFDRFTVRQASVQARPHSPNSQPMKVTFNKGQFVMTYDYAVFSGRDAVLSLLGQRAVTKLRVPGTFGFHYFLAECKLQ